jgi:hypothetical protein
MDELRLDGNAVAGVLHAVFGLEMTEARGSCGTCGKTEPIGAEHVYMHAPGAVVRCCHCNNVLMVVVQAHEEYVLAFSGLKSLQLRAEA